MRRSVLTALIILLVMALQSFAQHDQHTVTAPDALKWTDPPALPGTKLAVVHGNPRREGLFVYRLKLPANYKIAPHRHKASESVTVLQGVFFIGVGEKLDQGSGKEMPVGAFAFIPPTHPHFAWSGNEDTIVQMHGYGPTDIMFVNPADDPRKK
jgi:hypothetical protein